MALKPKRRRKRTGIFIYCSDELKRRINAARKYTHRTISGYVLQCTILQLERDEAEMEKRTRSR